MVVLKTLILALAIGSVSAAPWGSGRHHTRTFAYYTHATTSIATQVATTSSVLDWATSSSVPEMNATSAIPSLVSPPTTTVSLSSTTAAALATSSATPSPSSSANSSIWQPAVGSKWQIQLSEQINVDSSLDPTVEIYDIDLFDTPQSSIDQLHALGKKVICYFSAGSYEPDRPDSAQFTASDKGNVLDGWPDEYWLNINSANVRSIMSARLTLAVSKGCDGVDPDNVDGYGNSNGLGLTEADSISYIEYLAQGASSLNLAIGLKNAGSIIPNVLSVVQYSVNEQCIVYSECETFHPLIDAGKPVFHIEYPDSGASEVVPALCATTGAAAGTAGFSTVLKNMDLDAAVQYCT